MKQTEYIFSNKVSINEGFTTGMITRAAIYFTNNYFYIIPYDAIGSVGGGTISTNITQEKYTNSDEFLNHISDNIDDFSDIEFNKIMTDFLPKERVIHIGSLTKFTISSGWLTAGIKFKELNGNLKTMSVKPREILKKLKDFYRL